MLSIEELRAEDPDLKDLSDKEVEEIRASFYDLGQIIWEDWIRSQKNNGKEPTL